MSREKICRDDKGRKLKRWLLMEREKKKKKKEREGEENNRH